MQLTQQHIIQQAQQPTITATVCTLDARQDERDAIDAVLI